MKIFLSFGTIVFLVLMCCIYAIKTSNGVQVPAISALIPWALNLFYHVLLEKPNE